ncbi:superoxide dismutase [Mn], mitochondrial-like [Impatiens glandulifera]|uniref:superoxide dismutase [Mn], mitochondrial-like n=1 Tax=Impatiens glandulifera TaxID=253017 RepID=UPI001FB0A2E5|nr:superoxide dismutase [Mn], mitochondrial-like [Impatiens glandulifera]
MMMAFRRAPAIRKVLTKLGLASSAAAPPRAFQTFSLPDLPYDYGALEPAISGEIMQLHHQKHHQTYVTNYNKSLDQLHHAINKADSPAILKLQNAIKFNGGGHINHSIFWNNLAPVSEGGGEPPKGSFGWAIDADFGSFEALVRTMTAEGVALQGSGWVWLGLDKDLKTLVIETTVNQDPLVTKGPSLVPLIGIDVWEHAYYLQYKNVRPDYLKNIWSVVNWKYASEVYARECPFAQAVPRCS